MELVNKDCALGIIRLRCTYLASQLKNCILQSSFISLHCPEGLLTCLWCLREKQPTPIVC